MHSFQNYEVLLPTEVSYSLNRKACKGRQIHVCCIFNIIKPTNTNYYGVITCYQTDFTNKLIVSSIAYCFEICLSSLREIQSLGKTTDYMLSYVIYTSPLFISSFCVFQLFFVSVFISYSSCIYSKIQHSNSQLQYEIVALNQPILMITHSFLVDTLHQLDFS